ncbi:MAG: hypothetical protein PF961_08480 [Planctomycetota bacterium]|nr:hypothetical protein [Planctomycetota bacterium]
MHSQQIKLGLEQSWPRLGAAIKLSLLARLKHRLIGDRISILASVGVCALLAIGWLSTNERPAPASSAAVLAMLPQSQRPSPSQAAPIAGAAEEVAREEAAQPAVEPKLPATIDFAPDRFSQERRATTHLPIDSGVPTRIRIITIKAKVTAYTPYDHVRTRPEWADGIVAWHPHGKRRSVRNHPYGFATDWAQFPPGATFINVPGYLEKTYPSFPQRFIVVDDACGAARKARRHGRQPIIDARFINRSSAIGGRNAWGSKNLNVEVVFPAGYQIPSSLRRWVVSDELRVYYGGRRIE